MGIFRTNKDQETRDSYRIEPAAVVTRWEIQEIQNTTTFRSDLSLRANGFEDVAVERPREKTLYFCIRLPS
jgi:hypothetical protein